MSNAPSSDVLGASSDLDIYVYDRANHEAFLGHVRISLDARVDNNKIEGWYKLEPRDAQEETVSGEIHLQLHFQKTDKKHYGPEDFQILKLIGKGSSTPYLQNSQILIHSQALSVKSTKFERRTLNVYTQ